MPVSVPIGMERREEAGIGEILFVRHTAWFLWPEFLYGRKGGRCVVGAATQLPAGRARWIHSWEHREHGFAKVPFDVDRRSERVVQRLRDEREGECNDDAQY